MTSAGSSSGSEVGTATGSDVAVWAGTATGSDEAVSGDAVVGTGAPVGFVDVAPGVSDPEAQAAITTRLRATVPRRARRVTTCKGRACSSHRRFGLAIAG